MQAVDKVIDSNSIPRHYCLQGMSETAQTTLEERRTLIEDECRRTRQQILCRGRKDNLSQQQIEEMTTARLLTIHAYFDAIEEEFVRQTEVASALAIKFKKPLDAVLQDIQHCSRLTIQRRVNVYNAWKHIKNIDIAELEGLTEEEKSLLLNLTERYDDDDVYNDFLDLLEHIRTVVLDQLDVDRNQQMKGQK
ncbi:hypothetical protein ACEPAG_9412 [Sanghuangporus baumii]